MPISTIGRPGTARTTVPNSARPNAISGIASSTSHRSGCRFGRSLMVVSFLRSISGRRSGGPDCDAVRTSQIDALSRLEGESSAQPLPQMSDPYEELRPLLFSIAYRMLGSVSEAEDAVQEAFLRFHVASKETEIESPKAYMSARLSIDNLRS